MTPVLLASMPFAPLFKPSIALGLLQAAVKRRGIDCESLYLALDFAAATGVSTYLRLSESFPVTDLAGEWVFREAAFGPDAERDRRYLEETAARSGRARDRAMALEFAGDPDPRAAFARELERARAPAARFVDQCARRIAERAPRIVGITTVFQQQLASMALAQRLRALLPGVFIVAGGANVEGSMGAQALREFGALDAIVSGEGDVAFPELVERVLAGRAVDGIPGVLTRRAARAGLAPVRSVPVEDLDALPDPDYDDYFVQYEQALARLDRPFVPHLLFESSRGCWWGEVSHCSFCGLNGQTMRFRSKGAARALDELERLARRHPGAPVAVVDNIIDNRYFDDFVPMLAARGLGLELFYEVKANLRRAHVRKLRAAGISTIQPGIESLDSDTLRLMGKGVKALNNVQLLKLCAEEGVDPRWNVLWGFPGEKPEGLAASARLAAHLSHLPPPVGGSPIRLDRFSPNYEQAAQRGFADVRPSAAYGLIYPFGDESLRRLAYYFDFGYAQPYDVQAAARPLEEAIERWNAEHAAGACLFASDLDGVLLVWDLRPGATRTLRAFTGTERELLMACAEIAGEQVLVGEGDAAPGRRAALEALESQGLVVREGRSWLALPLALGRWAPNARSLRCFVAAAARLGTREGEGGDVLIAVDEARAMRPSSAPQAADPLRLSPGHFSWEGRGMLRVHLEALSHIDWNRMRLSFSGIPQEHAWT
ncbi:MAG TPA: RiPP maturation radical SAM C-methyltransferase [Usitatibacter sp.]|nr:RiPP maturation radical SAM C-methyltransferase [Usitatibacter sp.]